VKQSKYQAVFISIVFLLTSYFFSRGYFSYFFFLVFGLMLMITFFKEEIRLFSWMLLSFFGGNLIRFYADKFIEELNNNEFIELILSQLLFIIPILTVCYVIKAFNREIMSFRQKPSKGMLLFTLIVLFLVFMMMAMTHNNYFSVFLSFLLFSSCHVIFQEFIWRGILLTQMIKITNLRFGTLITTFAFGINSTLFGFSATITSIYCLFGFLLGYVTIRTKSLFPAIVIHMLILFILFLSGMIHIPFI
jgi:uncharacterized protein